MNERIKQVRLALGLSQDSFGARIGLGKSSLSKIERGANSTTDQTILSICREFGVDEVWLRTGEGEMFSQDRKTVIDRVVAEYKLSESDRALLTAFLELNESDRAAILRFRGRRHRRPAGLRRHAGRGKRSGGHIVFYRRLVFDRAAARWRARQK